MREDDLVTITETAPAVKRSSAPVGTAEPIAPVRAKRSWIYTAGAIALIIAGALISVFIYSSSSHTQQVFVVSHDIQRGDVINQSDLATLDLAMGQRTQGIIATDQGAVIGKIATVDLPTGSLLTTASIASSLTVPAGQALVGLSLKPAQLPAQLLVAGDHVAIVPVATDATVAPVNSTAISAVVSGTTHNATSSTTIVDVYVSESVAADLTSRAAAGAVAIYLTPQKK